MTKIKYLTIIFIMANIPLWVFAINLNTFTALLTNFNNTKTVLETAKILSQLNFKDKTSQEVIKKFESNNKKRYQDEITIFSRNESKLNDAYNLIQAYYYIYGNDYWYKVLLSRITSKLILAKTKDTLLKSIFINENFDLLMKNLSYVSKKLYEYNEVLTNLLPMYRWKVKEIYNSMENALKEKKYKDFINNYEILKNLDNYKDIKKSIGFDFTLPSIEKIDFNNLNVNSVEIFKYFPKLFTDVYNKNLDKAKESFQRGRYTDTINILSGLLKITDEASNLISETQRDSLSKMLVKTKAIRSFILGISDLYLEIQRMNSWEDFKNTLDNIYKDFDSKYIIYFDHAFINGKLIIIFRDYKENLSNYIKIKKDNKEDTLTYITSLYNETQLIISKIKYNDMLKDKFNDLSKYLKEFIQTKKRESANNTKILIGSVSLAISVLLIIIFWVFTPTISKANLLMFVGMKKKALSIMQKRLIQEADNPQFHLTLGEIYEKLGRKNEAEYHYKIAMQYYKNGGKNEN